MAPNLVERATASGAAGLRWLDAGWQWLTTSDPWSALGIFLFGSMVMLYRLNAMEQKGLEGTVLGTLIMPYASGLPNLAFAYSLGRLGGDGSVVVENCLVNNVTNLTLLIGLPALFWTLGTGPPKASRSTGRAARQHRRINTLSLSLSLLAMFFFTGVLWALGKDGRLDFGDGLVLVGVFVFWQAFHVFDVLKTNIHKRRTLPRTLILDAFMVVLLGGCMVHGIDRLVAWVVALGPGFFLYDQLGFLSGCLMVLPNGLLAAYYARAGRGDIVYSSQVGDGHICIPLCIGVFALFAVIFVPPRVDLWIPVILGAGLLHLILIVFVGKLSRWMGGVLTTTYFFFLALVF